MNALRILALCLSILLGAAASPAKADLFPQYEVIAPNVAFWVKVYSTYPTTRVIVHDSHDLNIVYDVIAVKPYDAPGARKINRQRVKRAKNKYRLILKGLAANPHVEDQESRRVAQLFGPQADARTFRRASQQVRSQLGQKDRFQAGLIRSGAYLEQIRSIFKSYGVPEDLAFLPHVESSFNVNAYSKFGAAGIWQFTRSTGKRFMKVGYVLDERRDPIRATHAAAKLLKENYAKLGSWPLAITAYNHGAAGMARARQKHGTYPAIFSAYHSRTFKFASRNFYSEFLAARQVASDHQAYFGNLTLATPTPSHTVVLDGYARFADLCAHYGTAPETLRRLNPALRSPVFNDQKYVPKGYRLRLPFDTAPSGTTLAAIPPSLYKSAQKPSRFYTVQRGDTAGRIARNHGVRLSDLILANNLSARATIYPRQTLRIPLPGEKVKPPPKQPPVIVAPEPPVVVAAVDRPGTENTDAPGKASLPEKQEVPADSAPQRATAVQRPESAAPEAVPAPQGAPATAAEPAPEPPAALAPAPTARPEAQVAPAPEAEAVPAPGPAPPPQEPVAPVLEAEATPAPAAQGPAEPASGPVPVPTATPAIEVARVPEAEAVPASQAVIAPEPSLGTSTVVPPIEIVSIDVRFDRVSLENQRPIGIIQVEVEETLGHYAEWAGVRTQQIRRLNGLRFGRTLQLHQQVKIPLDKISAARFEEQRYEYHKRLQEDFFAVYRVAELEPYRVQQGDSYWMLSREKFGIPMWLLKHYNLDVDLAALRIQQKLMIPAIEKTEAGDPGAVSNEEIPETG